MQSIRFLYDPEYDKKNMLEEHVLARLTLTLQNQQRDPLQHLIEYSLIATRSIPSCTIRVL